MASSKKGAGGSAKGGARAMGKFNKAVGSGIAGKSNKAGGGGKGGGAKGGGAKGGGARG